MAHILEIGKNKINFSKRTLIMGILNVTPDSFSDGGRFYDLDAAKKQALKMQEEGSDFIDIGGESTRPGSKRVSLEEEIERVLPVLVSIRREIDVPISIDSYKPQVIEEALNNGARIINDITGLRNKKVRELAIKGQYPVIIMHMKGAPQNMQISPKYEDVVQDIYKFFKEQSGLAIQEGLHPSKIIIDPGIGFGKTLEHNIEILKRLPEFKSLGYPILIGTSRKSFIGAISHAEAGERLPGTIASASIAATKGANIVRVHDVAAIKQAMQVVDAIKGSNDKKQ